MSIYPPSVPTSTIGPTTTTGTIALTGNGQTFTTDTLRGGFLLMAVGAIAVVAARRRRSANV